MADKKEVKKEVVDNRDIYDKAMDDDTYGVGPLTGAMAGMQIAPVINYVLWRKRILKPHIEAAKRKGIRLSHEDEVKILDRDYERELKTRGYFKDNSMLYGALAGGVAGTAAETAYRKKK